jgi:hypothetical protein
LWEIEHQYHKNCFLQLNTALAHNATPSGFSPFDFFFFLKRCKTSLLGSEDGQYAMRASPPFAAQTHWIIIQRKSSATATPVALFFFREGSLNFQCLLMPLWMRRVSVTMARDAAQR